MREKWAYKVKGMIVGEHKTDVFMEGSDCPRRVEHKHAKLDRRSIGQTFEHTEDTFINACNNPTLRGFADVGIGEDIDQTRKKRKTMNTFLVVWMVMTLSCH